MEPEGLLSPGHKHAISPYPGQVFYITLIIYPFQIPNDITFPSNFRPTTWVLPLWFPQKKLVCLLHYTNRAICRSHHNLRYLSVLIISKYPQRLRSSMLNNFLHSPLCSSSFGPNSFLSILFSITCNFSFPLK